MKRRTQTFRGRLIATHGVAELRKDFEHVFNDPKPPSLDFRWTSIPKRSSIDDVVPGCDCALKLIDDSVLIGHYIVETAHRIRFRPWGRGELVLAKTEVVGARPLGAHTWAERRAVTQRQAATAQLESATGLVRLGPVLGRERIEPATNGLPEHV